MPDNLGHKANATRAMKALRLQHHWTLQEIATIFGVTREAIRLRVGNTGHFSPPSEGRGHKSAPKADDANQTMALQALRATVHILDPRFITDGFGNLWNAKCPTCGGKMSVVRPGDARCEVCG